MLATLMIPDSGHASIDGHDVVRERYAVRRRIGVLSDARGLYPRLTARENIRYYGALQGLAGDALEARIDELVRALGIADIADRRAQGFSQGERMKVAIARALVHDPQTILLDEPTNGLDIMSIRALRDLLRELRGAGKCLLFSSHVMQEVSALCDSIVILGHGRVVATGTAAELVAQSGDAVARGRLRAPARFRRRPRRMTGTARAPNPRSSRIAIVARKEIVDIFRDRRTMLVTLVTAIVAGPVLMLLVLNLIARQADKVRELTLPVVGIEHAPALAGIPRAPAGHADAGARRISRRRYEAATSTSCSRSTPAFAADVAQGKPGTVRLAYDRSRDRARAAIAEVEALLRAFNREWGRGRLLLRGIAPEVANPLNVESRDLATPQSSGALVLFLIAFYGLFAAVMGGMAAALDTTAGERERMSLEPLLTTPVAPLELATGKWLAVSLLNATAVVLTLTGFYLTLRFAPLPAVGIPFLFGLAEFGRFVVALVPLILLMPAILLYVGCRGRTFKEAQSNLSVLLFARVAPPDRADVPAEEGAGVADLDSGVGPVRAAVARAARRSVAVARVAAVVRGSGAADAGALLAVARLFSRESLLAGK